MARCRIQIKVRWNLFVRYPILCLRTQHEFFGKLNGRIVDICHVGQKMDLFGSEEKDPVGSNSVGFEIDEVCSATLMKPVNGIEVVAM